MDEADDRPASVETNAAGVNIGSVNTDSGTTIVAGRDVNVNLTLASQAIDELIAISGRSNRVREEILLWQDNFDDVRRGIKLVCDFKDLHDLFHRLLYSVYNPIQQEIGRFPDEPEAQINLDQYSLQLGAMLDEARLLLGSPTFEMMNASWLVELEEACQNLQQALGSGEAAQLRVSSRLLRHMLNVQPTLVNNQLTQSARSLDLNKMVDALQKIASCIDPARENTEVFTQVQMGIATLQQMNAQLKLQVGVHDRWQGLENELRQLESNLEDLDLVWKFLKKGLLELCAGGAPAPWAAALTKSLPLLDQALAGGEANGIRRSFLSIKTQVGMRFYSVDFELKRMCGNLRDIENPLRAMRKIQ